MNVRRSCTDEGTYAGIDSKIPLYHINSGHMMSLADEEVIALECSKQETPSMKELC